MVDAFANLTIGYQVNKNPHVEKYDAKVGNF